MLKINVLIVFLLFYFICTYSGVVGAGSSKLNVQNSESIKIQTGEKLVLECPQSNPTWFYQSRDIDTEDLIVTRHGVVNVDYKHKLTCSNSIAKHKIISINKVDIEDEGIYTCLYTISSSDDSVDNVDGYEEENIDLKESYAIQQRYIFNVTVYSKLSSIFPSLWKLFFNKFQFSSFKSTY
jgi:hypothetical protein